jgi:transposase
MEACCGAHHLGRALQARGRAIRLMSPEYVQPYVKAQKNDEWDGLVAPKKSYALAYRRADCSGR